MDTLTPFTRRGFLHSAGFGIGGLALAWLLCLLCAAIVSTAYSIIVTGAKIWIDSIGYFQLALVLFDGDLLGSLYRSEFGFRYQHVTPGLPFLIRALDAVFHGYLWPVLALIQGLLSAIAVTYFVLSFRNKLGSAPVA